MKFVCVRNGRSKHSVVLSQTELSLAMIIPLWFGNIYLTTYLLQPVSLCFKESVLKSPTRHPTLVFPPSITINTVFQKKGRHSHESLCPQSQCFPLFPIHKHTGCEGNGQMISFTTPPVLLNWSNKQQTCPPDPLMFSCCTLQHQNSLQYQTQLLTQIKLS